MLIEPKTLLNKELLDTTDTENVDYSAQDNNTDPDQEFWDAISDSMESVRKNLAEKTVDLMHQSSKNSIENSETSLRTEKMAMDRKQTDAGISLATAAAQASLKRTDQWNNS
jgi:hypothetical protein